jgi:hypothetical protein
MRLGSSLSRDFPCLFTHHIFVIRLRDKINEAFYCNRILRGSPERPSGNLVGTTLKLTTGQEVTDGHSHFPTGSHLKPRHPPSHYYLLPLILPPQASKPTTASANPTGCGLRMALGSGVAMIWWRHCSTHGEREGKAAGG